VVCDGFTGNVVLKGIEGFHDLTRSEHGAERPLPAPVQLRELRRTPVLGVNGNVIIGHGISNAQAIKNMILFTREVVESKLNARIARSIPVTTLHPSAQGRCRKLALRTMKTTAAITAVQGYVPEFVLSNAVLETMVDTNDAWITERTGIKERRILKGKDQGHERNGRGSGERPLQEARHRSRWRSTC
jgi:hypothetical protein